MKMTPKKKRKIYNIIMAAVIFLIAFSCVMLTGSLKGWFGEKGTAAVAGSDSGKTVPEIKTDGISGNVNVERSGVAYSLEDGNVLRSGDLIETLNGSSVDLVFSDSVISLEENSQTKLSVSEDGDIIFDLKSGSAVANVSDPCEVNLAGRKWSAKSAVFVCSAPYGSGNFYVLSDSLETEEQKVDAGNEALIRDSGIETSELSLDALNDFELEKLQEISQSRALCFSGDEIAEQISSREAEARSTLEESLNGSSEETAGSSAQGSGTSGNGNSGTESSGADDAGESGGSNSGAAGNGGSSSDGLSGSTGSGNGGGTSGNASGGSSEKGDQQSGGTSGNSSTCTVEIRCDTILQHMSDLKAGKSQYVPSDGTILASTAVTFEDGDTAFDILKKACGAAGIQLEYSWTPGYGAYYVQGIHNLYEFDCGSKSGWIYKVNGWSPNYGASSYQVKNGDVIGWYYTCSGYGSDV
jgi:hypothetical protein